MLDPVYGDGTITKRSDGRLQVTVTVDGRRRYAMVPARLVASDPKAAMRRAEAERRRLQDARDGDAAGSAQTLEAWLRSWIDSLESAKTKRVAWRTLHGYRVIVEQHLVPSLGRRRLDRLTEGCVQAWIDGNDAKPQTIRNQHAVLRRALNVAVRRRLMTRNAALGVELPPVAEFEGSPLTLDEVRALIAATAADPLGALWILAIDTGWREAELLGLARDDVDLEAATVTLTAQLQRRAGEWVRVPTKRPRRLATVSIAPATVEALRRHLIRTAAERDPSWPYYGHLFLTSRGNPVGQSEVLRKFHDACDRAEVEHHPDADGGHTERCRIGIPRRRVHDLRGTSATVLRELGVPEDIRMLRHGHATTRMARKYAAARTGVDRVAADALGRALEG